MRRPSFGPASLAAILLGLLLAADAAAGAAASGPLPRQRSEAALDLKAFLEKAAAYCRRLESSVLDFVAREEIEESVRTLLQIGRSGEVNPGWSDAPVRITPEVRHMSMRAAPVTNRLVYDYQCVRKAGALRETRTLLLLNGAEINEPNAPLRTSSMVYRNALLTPINLFGAKAQTWYDYRIEGRDRFENRPVAVIAVSPKPDISVPLCPRGKAWIDPATLDILKIEWVQIPTGNLEAFAAWARAVEGSLRLTMRAEFSAERNGLRFPSRLGIEEAYVRKRGRLFIRAVTNVVFKDFKFFTVETSHEER